MKKILFSKSKKKWIVGGALLFGGVSLLTTGFATWVVGVNQLRQNLGTVVQVEGTLNESVKLTVKPASVDNAMKVNVGEDHTKANNEIIGSKDGATDFNIDVDIKIEIGSEYLRNNDIESVSFEFNYETIEGVENNKTTGNKVNVATDTKTHKAGNYTYLDIDPRSTLAVKGLDESGPFTKDTTSSTTIYTVTNFNLPLFKWGTFFGNTADDIATIYSPATYYNKLFNDSDFKSSLGLGITDDSADMDLVVSELTAMQTALHDGTIVVDAVLNTTLKTQ